MNLIDAEVTEVIGRVYEAHGKYWRRVKIKAYGRESETELMCNTKEEAEMVKKVGHKTQV